MKALSFASTVEEGAGDENGNEVKHLSRGHKARKPR